MKNKRKICAALMLISFMSHCAAAADDEIFTGSCARFMSKSCRWTLNKTSGTIFLEDPELGVVEAPVIEAELAEFVKIGVIANRTFQIPPTAAFVNLPNLKNVSIPDTVYEIMGLVYNCPQVEELTFNSPAARICSNCDGLKTINLGSRASILKDRFDDSHYYGGLAYRCPNLISINRPLAKIKCYLPKYD